MTTVHGKRRGARAHVRGVSLGRVGSGVAAVWLAACAGAGAPDAQTSPFPRVDRPVAPIITPAYSTEAERDRKGEAERVLNRLGVAHGMRVADIGAGAGYYTVRLAQRLGSGAAVFAQDVERR